MPAPSTAAASLPAIAPTATATPGDGVILRLTQIEAVQGVARQLGEKSGPAVRFTVVVQNTGKDEINLALFAVNAYYGANRLAAAPIGEPGGRPLTGRVPAGGEATGTYVFSVPTSERSSVSVTIDRLAGRPVTVFSGAFPQ